MSYRVLVKSDEPWYSKRLWMTPNQISAIAYAKNYSENSAKENETVSVEDPHGTVVWHDYIVDSRKQE